MTGLTLFYAIFNNITKADIDCTLTSEMKSLMANSLDDFIHQAIKKFIAGQKEHGGDIRNRELNIELSKEHIDMFWYMSASKWPTSKVLSKKRLFKKQKNHESKSR